MVNAIFQKGLGILLKRQTNILSAAFIIMSTIIASQLLGLVRQRMLAGTFGASNILGVYHASSVLPDSLFQLVIAGAFTSAFIPVFSDFITKNKEKEAHQMASALLMLSLIVFSILSAVLGLFARFFLQFLNPGEGFTNDQLDLMSNLMRIMIFGQILFIVGTFFSVLLQSYNHFFIPGIASALYNLGIILGIFFLSFHIGIYAPAIGVIIGSLFYILAQIPMVIKIGFSFRSSFSFKTPGVLSVIHLMWPRTISLAIFQLSTVVTVMLISFLPSSGRNLVIYDYAKILAFAPVVLFGQAIAQAAFPVLSREKEKLEEFKTTFLTSFNQLLYLILPISVLFLILRIPIVRLVFGVGLFDWDATVLTGRTLAFFSVSMFAQALAYLIARAYYALHDTKTPFIVGSVTTALTIMVSAFFVMIYRSGFGQIIIPYSLINGFIKGSFIFSFGIEGIALAISIGSVVNIIILMIFLGKKIGTFNGRLYRPFVKISAAAFLTAFALYIPIKLFDRLVFDTTRTVGLLLLTGISSFVGLSLYLFLTWLFNVKEAMIFIIIFKKLGNWREILASSKEPIDETRMKL